MRYVYDQKDLDESFDKITDDFESLQEHLDDFEETLDNLEVFIEDQMPMQMDACLAYLVQLQEIIADCLIRFNRYNKRYETDYEKQKEVITRLTPYRSIWKQVMEKKNENTTNKAE